jgi:hypothetical protein
VELDTWAAISCQIVRTDSTCISQNSARDVTPGGSEGGPGLEVGLGLPRFLWPPGLPNHQHK